MKTIESIQEWIKFAKTLKELGYKLWQMQYGWDSPEGSHSWFMKAGEKDIEVVTHNKDVHQAILKY